LAALFLLVSCVGPEAPPAPSSVADTEQAEPDPSPTLEILSIRIGEQEVLFSAESFIAREGPFDAEDFRDKLSLLPALQSVDLKKAKVADAAARALCDDFPHIRFQWILSVGGQSLPSDTQDVETADADALLAALPYLPDLKTARVLEQGETPKEQETCRAMADARPDVVFVWDYALYGKVFSTDAETVNLDKTRLTDTEELRAALPYFPRLTRVEIDDTGLADAQLGELVDEFLSIRFVWTVQLRYAVYRVKTDDTCFTTKALAYWGRIPTRLTSADLEPLRWCRDMVAIDIGHNAVTTLDFLRPLQKLEMLIIADNRVRDADITALTELPRLSYLEVFMNKLTDASVFTRMTALEDLNIGFNEITDLSPLHECAWLKRLWVCRQLKKAVPQKEQEALRAALPDCAFSFNNAGSTNDGWRMHPRYYWMRAMLNRPVPGKEY